jgi:V/A-type H+-transporting ATPase subunit D
VTERTLTATRITLLELGDERRMVREGYELLDEKRMLLAAEILAGLRRYRVLREEWLAQLDLARRALTAAVRRHGFDALTVHPGERGALAALAIRPRSLLGLALVEATLETLDAPLEFEPAETSAEASACAAAFRELARMAAAMAGLSASLRIMAKDYARTERRAKALENVILPEIESDIRFVDSQLEAIDQEESIRVREARGRMA